MAGYVFHIIHAYEMYMSLLESTRAKMSKDALKYIILGAVSPDLVDKYRFDEETNKNVWTGDKEKTHFNIEHPIYGKSYMIPDMQRIENLFLKKDPASLGVLAHLRYDLDHIENILLTYFKPIEGDMYVNVKTGEKISGLMLWGRWDEDESKRVYGQLYQLYDKFNAEMTEKYTNKIAAVYGREYPATKDGFLRFIKWLLGNPVPLTGVEEMDKYRGQNVDLYTEIETYFDNDGAGCIINARPDELLEVVKSSAKALAKQIDELYADAA